VLDGGAKSFSSLSEDGESQKLDGFFFGRTASRSETVGAGGVREGCSSRGRSFLRPKPANKSSSGSEAISLLAIGAALVGSEAAGGNSELLVTPNNRATVSHDDLNLEGCSAF
jgi:hypothetical protein